MKTKDLRKKIIGKKLLSIIQLEATEEIVRAVRVITNGSDEDGVDNLQLLVFFNGITDNYLLEITGKCSIEADTMDSQLEVICKTGPGAYKKHFLGLSDNVAYFVEQLESNEASAYHYRVTFKPQEIIPDIDLRVDTTDLPRVQN